VSCRYGERPSLARVPVCVGPCAHLRSISSLSTTFCLRWAQALTWVETAGSEASVEAWSGAAGTGAGGYAGAGDFAGSARQAGPRAVGRARPRSRRRAVKASTADTIPKLLGALHPTVKLLVLLPVEAEAQSRAAVVDVSSSRQSLRSRGRGRCRELGEDEDVGRPRGSGGSDGHGRRNQSGLGPAAQREDGHNDRRSAPDTGDLQRGSSLAGLRVGGAAEVGAPAKGDPVSLPWLSAAAAWGPEMGKEK
jgi:hypothetical protein